MLWDIIVNMIYNDSITIKEVEKLNNIYPGLLLRCFKLFPSMWKVDHNFIVKYGYLNKYITNLQTYKNINYIFLPKVKFLRIYHLEYCNFPKHLMELKIDECYCDISNIPETVIKINIKNFRGNNIILPTYLKSLTIESQFYNGKLSPLPKTLEYLNIKNCYNYTTSLGIFPKRLKSLSIRNGSSIQYPLPKKLNFLEIIYCTSDDVEYISSFEIDIESKIIWNNVD